MTFEEFKATAAPVSDELWDVIVSERAAPGIPRDAITMYDGEYILHLDDGGFWPHAWWYRPAKRETLEEAEEVLFEWRKEWT